MTPPSEIGTVERYDRARGIGYLRIVGGRLVFFTRDALRDKKPLSPGDSVRVVATSAASGAHAHSVERLHARVQDAEAADRLALRFERDPELTESELAELALPPARALMNRPRVHARLGQRGWAVERRGRLIVGVRLPPLAAATGATVELHAAELELVRSFVARRISVLLSGPPGTGKSLLAERAVGEPFEVMSLSSETDAADFLGQWTLQGQTTTFEPAPALRAAIAKSPLVIHELDCCPSGVALVLQRLLEKPLPFPLPPGAIAGATMVDHWNGGRFTCVATCNTKGGGGPDDHTFAGARAQNSSLLDRFGAFVEIDYPSPVVEEAFLVAKTGIARETARAIVAVAHHVRRAFSSGDLRSTLSLRGTQTWASFLQCGITAYDAFRYTCLNRVEAGSAERAALREIYSRTLTVPPGADDGTA